MRVKLDRQTVVAEDGALDVNKQKTHTSVMLIYKFVVTFFIVPLC